MRDLYTRALYEISSQDPHMRHLYTRSPDIPGPPRSLHRSSLQDLFTKPLWEISVQDLLISLDLWELLTTSSLQKTSIRIQHTESTEKVARTKSKSAPRYCESDPTRANSAEGCRSRNKNAPGWAPATFHQQNEHGATARAIRHAQSPERVAFANIKSAPRHSETPKITVPTAPWRQNYNTKCDFSMFCDASTAPATKKWVRGIRNPVTVTATRNDVNIADPNSTTVSQNEHFELSKIDFKSTKYCACHEKWRFFTTSNFEQPLRRFCTPLKTLTFCTFPDFRKSARRAGENAPPKWTSQRPRLAQAKYIFSISRELLTERVDTKSGDGCAHHRFTPDAFLLP